MNLTALVEEAERLARNIRRERDQCAGSEVESTLRVAEALAWSAVDDLERALRLSEVRAA